MYLLETTVLINAATKTDIPILILALKMLSPTHKGDTKYPYYLM